MPPIDPFLTGVAGNMLRQQGQSYLQRGQAFMQVGAAQRAGRAPLRPPLLPVEQLGRGGCVP